MQREGEGGSSFAITFCGTLTSGGALTSQAFVAHSASPVLLCITSVPSLAATSSRFPPCCSRRRVMPMPATSSEYNAGDFFHDARSATADIISRHSVPIVAGGTGLYLSWYTHTHTCTVTHNHTLTHSHNDFNPIALACCFCCISLFPPLAPSLSHSPHP